MPNLLKSLPREIFEKEDSKFIYNVLNPLLFDKIKDTDSDTTLSYTVGELLDKDINLRGQFDTDFILPFNINSREFHVYMSNDQEKQKIEYFGNKKLVMDLDNLKDYIFFYFGVEGYGFLRQIIEKYYFISYEYDKNRELYEFNYAKYLKSMDIKKKKIFKGTYEHFKKLYDEFQVLKDEFDILLSVIHYYNLVPYTKIVDIFSNELSKKFKIKTFDSNIVFANSKLFSYLEMNITYKKQQTKYTFSGKNIIESVDVAPTHIFELIALFAMEIDSLKVKYDSYLSLLVDNGNGYALEKSEYKKLKNNVFKQITLDLDSDNLTYFVNEEKNELEIYLYFSQEFRIEESTVQLIINDKIIYPSIHSLAGYIGYGYTLFEYFDETTKYYKITVHDYFFETLDNENSNYEINDILVRFDAVASIYQHPKNPQELNLDTNGFLDNFIIYKKNIETGFYENINIPFKIKVGIDEKEERYSRLYEFLGINDVTHNDLISCSDIIIGCYEYDYVYEPKLYVDFFKYNKFNVYFRFNTIMQYVLIDDVMNENFELQYYDKIMDDSYSTNINKNIIMYDGKTYRKLYDDIDYMRLINPYNETNYAYISKITYDMYKTKEHTSPILIDGIINKIPFKDNLKYLDKTNFDINRNALFFMVDGNQMVVPLNEDGLSRGLNYENLNYNSFTQQLEYNNTELCSSGFKLTNVGIYLRNKTADTFDKIEASRTIKLHNNNINNVIFYDIYEMSPCIIIKDKKFKINNLYIDTYKNALKHPSNVLFIESKYGIPRYKTIDGIISDVNIFDDDKNNNKLTYNVDMLELIYTHTEHESYTMHLTLLSSKQTYHRQTGMNSFSIFYSGNVIPENSNKTFFGRENIYNSMHISDDIYNIGRSQDVFNNTQHHNLLGEQLDLDVADATQYNMEEESYLMFKSATASLKGLETYLKSNLKSISQDMGVSPVYLVQRNRFISEWVKVSSVLPSSIWAKDALKDLVADLMETKLINNKYDDLIDVFKNNEYEKFSLDTNNIHNILVHYILRFLEEDYLLEDFSYFLLHTIWIDNNRKKIVDFIMMHSNEQTKKLISSMRFESKYEKEQLFYIFTNELEKIKKETIDSYTPLSNYSDWNNYIENNHVKFDKPFKYDVLDISEYITMSVDWKYPIILIRPLNDDGVFTKRDYRFIDLSIATNSQITYDDNYNEYIDDVKNKLNKQINYLDTTLRILNEISLEDGFDFLSINLVIVKWVVERFLPNYILHNNVDDYNIFVDIIKNELRSADHPNMIVSYNKIKDHVILGDLGLDVNSIYGSIVTGGFITNSTIRLDIVEKIELEYLDKIKKPIEHYFDFLFESEKYDIITKVLALFTEDVIATSMIDLSMAINIKNSNGDKTFDIYEQMITDIFDEFLPFHTVLDKIIFSIKIMEMNSVEAIGKQLDANVIDSTMIEIFTHFIEKIRIQTLDNSIMFSRINILFPSEGLKLCIGYDEMPYDYDRLIKPAGHDSMLSVDDDYGVDDEWYVINRDMWKVRPENVYTPPEFAELLWLCIPDNEFEKVTDVYIDEYFHIKESIFEKDSRIESHFVDLLPVIDILQGVDESTELNVTEDYLINIDSSFNIRFYNIDEIAHDEMAHDEYIGPEDQTSLIDMRESMYQHIIHDFYEKLNISVMDSIWTDITILYDIDDIPGHDEFGVDEYYHQRGPDTLGQEISTMVYDELLHQGFGINVVDMSDISLVDAAIAITVSNDYKTLILNTVVDTVVFINVDICINRFIDTYGQSLIYGHDEFALLMNFIMILQI